MIFYNMSLISSLPTLFFGLDICLKGMRQKWAMRSFQSESLIVALFGWPLDASHTVAKFKWLRTLRCRHSIDSLGVRNSSKMAELKVSLSLSLNSWFIHKANDDDDEKIDNFLLLYFSPLDAMRKVCPTSQLIRTIGFCLMLNFSFQTRKTFPSDEQSWAPTTQASH